MSILPSFDRTAACAAACCLLSLVLIAPPGWAQQSDTTSSFPMGDVAKGLGGGGGPGANVFTGAIGPTVIGGETYASLRLQPEFAVGKFGVGLDVPLMVSLEDGSFRSEEFTGGVGPLRLIRYLSYGREREDPVYVKVGDLSGATLGFGLIMYQYSNVASYEKRDWGTEFNVNLDQKVGLEGIYSDFSELSVVGLRPYVRPLELVGLGLPLLKKVEVGGLYVTDQSKTATPGGSPLTIVGADVGMPFSLAIVDLVPYAAYARIQDPGAGAFPDSVAADAQFDPGEGVSFGLNFDIQFVANLFSLSGKIERRLFDDNFTGSYFGPVYETNKFGFQQGLTTHPFEKVGRGTGQNGTFGALYGHILNSVLIGGSLQIPDKMERDAQGRVQQGTFLRVEARAPDVIPKLTAHAVYNRNPVENLGDAFVLDENSNLEMRVGYKVKSYLLVGTNYRWTFARVKENGDEEVKATSHVFPFVSLQLSFGNLLN